MVYFAGDSGYCPHFAEIGRRFPRIDLALLPIGAYEPRWFTRRNHVDPQEAVQAHLDLKACRSLGMHFGTFQLTDEAIDAPVLALRQAQAAAGVAATEFDVLAFGETRQFPMLWAEATRGGRTSLCGEPRCIQRTYLSSNAARTLGPHTLRLVQRKQQLQLLFKEFSD